MTGLLICAAAVLGAIGSILFGYAMALILIQEIPKATKTGFLGLALIATALYLAWRAGGAG